ncbi:hypothetical protein PF008_g2321 [Phytophthora fragariae]|uniref:Tc1-like transposase DDE domain-containing protein n=1 Tax=Phytophthora fragariae TaxID=53985 RepID=A0A6G0SHG8_9STRA|nr:hypothetical protein PF008_g2321 [Phytophthora fragariae]
MELVRKYKPPPIYAAYIIAKAYGHEVIYTPPYTPELQPIELIWAQAKQRIAKKPARNAADLNDKMAQSFEKVKRQHWVDVYRSVQKVEDG